MLKSNGLFICPINPSNETTLMELFSTNDENIMYSYFENYINTRNDLSLTSIKSPLKTNAIKNYLNIFDNITQKEIKYNRLQLNNKNYLHTISDARNVGKILFFKKK